MASIVKNNKFIEECNCVVTSTVACAHAHDEVCGSGYGVRVRVDLACTHAWAMALSELHKKKLSIINVKGK